MRSNLNSTDTLTNEHLQKLENFHSVLVEICMLTMKAKDVEVYEVLMIHFNVCIVISRLKSKPSFSHTDKHT